jgi:hypothetical protein
VTNFGSCEEKNSNKIISLSEKGVIVQFLNQGQSKVRKIKLDGCHFNPPDGRQNTLCCDYLLISADNSHHFVELKGTHVAHGVDQLRNTIDLLGLKKSAAKKLAYVITRCNANIGTDGASLKAKFLKDYGGLLHIARSGSKYSI